MILNLSRSDSAQACVLFTDINLPRTSRRPSTQRQCTTQHYISARQSAVSCCHTKRQVRSRRPHLEWRESSCTTPALSARRHRTPGYTVTQRIHISPVEVHPHYAHYTTALAGPPDVSRRPSILLMCFFANSPLSPKPTSGPRQKYTRGWVLGLTRKIHSAISSILPINFTGMKQREI